MQHDVLGRTLRRLLEPTKSELFFKSADPNDPRLGTYVTTLGKNLQAHTTTVAIIGVPQHKGVERNGGRAGAETAPTTIRHFLYRMALSGIQEAITSGKLRVVDAGNIKPDGLTLEQIHDELHDVVASFLRANVFPIVLGGGHDVAWPSLRAYETIGEPYGVINIDAHTDVRPMLADGRAHSGSPFRQMLDTPNSCLARGAFVEYGIQPQCVAKAHLEYVASHDGTVIMLDKARQLGSWQKAMSIASKANKLHLSLDMDCFASAFAPGVSAPSPDGFTPWEIAPCLHQAAQSASLTSFDVVELNPQYDVDNQTARLAATMIMQILSGLAGRA